MDLYPRIAARCAQRELCRSEVRKKLLALGASAEEAETLMDRLVAEGYVDEHRYAAAYASDKFRFDRWGRVKIAYGLRAKGVAEEAIREALSAIDEDDYRALLREFLAARLRQAADPDDHAARQKAARAAIGRGFEPHLVFDCLD